MLATQYAKVKSNPKPPNCKKVCATLKKAIMKKCKILNTGSQEMAVMVS